MYNNGKRRIEKITSEVIEKVKKELTSKSQHQIARETGFSQYTIWCIANRKYDKDEPLQKERYQNYFSHF